MAYEFPGGSVLAVPGVFIPDRLRRLLFPLAANKDHAVSILQFPTRRFQRYEPLEWERCRVPFWVRIFRPFTNFGQTLRAKKNGRWIYMREGDRDYDGSK